MPFIRTLAVCVLSVALASFASEQKSAGPLFSRFPLTLDEGHRTEALGPFFYKQVKDSEKTVAVPPLFSHTHDEIADAEEFDFVYPLFTYDRFGSEYRWQLFQLLSLAGGQNQKEVPQNRFTIFPIYFQQRSPDTNLNYTALFPIYGHLKNRLFRSEIDFALWPLYLKTTRRPGLAPSADEPFLDLPNRYMNARRGDVTTYNYVYPIFHLRYGDGLRGWQFWPLLGHEHKVVTTQTNDWNEVETIPGHDKRFVLWPFFFDETREIGTDNPEHQQALLPFYNELRSPRRDSTSYLWPLGVTVTDDRGQKYHEVDAPWPFVVFARGEGKYTSRVWPFFSRASNTNLESNFYLWPIYKYGRIHADPLDRERTRILFFLYSDTTEKNTETGATRHRTDFLPFFTRQKDFNGNSRLQLFALLEPILPASESIERNYSPLWSVWRSEENPKTGASSESLLWNLYRRDATPTTKKCSLLFGLFKYQSDPEGHRLRLFYGLIKHQSGLESNRLRLFFGLFKYQSDSEGKQLRLMYIPVIKSQKTTDYVPERR